MTTVMGVVEDPVEGDVSADEWGGRHHWLLPTPPLLDRLQVQLPPRPLELWLLATSPQPQ